MSEAPARAWAPASVSNVACGFDVLGFALEGPGDEVVAVPRPGHGVVVERIEGDGGRLSMKSEENTASVAVARLLDEAGHRGGVALHVYKGIPLASGVGSSAASAVAAVVAANAALRLGASEEALIRAAIEGEQRAASGSAHGDNVVPSLLGGFVLLHGTPSAPGVVRLPVPNGLTVALVRPHQEISTKHARALLGNSVPLRAAVAQAGRLGALVAALHRGDWELLAQSLVDEIAEPQRAGLIRGYDAMKSAALRSGAVGCSISGAGPSVFALCRSVADARGVAESMHAALTGEGIAGDVIVSPVGVPGARVVSVGHAAAS